MTAVGLIHSRCRETLAEGEAFERVVLTDAGLETLFQEGWSALQARLQAPQSWFVGERRATCPPEAAPGGWQPHLVDVQSDEAESVALLYVPPGLACFAGHFPGRPLLPGVVQVDWAAQLAATEEPTRGAFAGLSGVKFLAPVLPGAMLRLILIRQTRGVAFELRAAAGVRTRGVLHYRA